MTTFLYANNASTTLARSISPTDTVLNVPPGAGSMFPNPEAGQAFAVTLVDAATGLTNEICYCTSRSGDQLTVTRGQEGTNATSWQAGDTCASYITAGNLQNFLQETESGKFLLVDSTSEQDVSSPVKFSGITTVPTPTDYGQNQAIGASDADKRYVQTSNLPFTDHNLRFQAFTAGVGDEKPMVWPKPFTTDPVFCSVTPVDFYGTGITASVRELSNEWGSFNVLTRDGNPADAELYILVGGYMQN